jgi:vanillate O-demethylase monooxygenase subunit
MTFARNAWYCAAFAAEVGDAPIARRILGDPVMLVRDTAGAVRAIGDRCPHRFAPLHLGVRDSDTVECPYHGLKFDLNGACILNPHGQGRIPATARVPSYPVAERDGVIWLWPGEAAMADESEIPDLQLIDRGDRAPVSGYLTMPVDYRLVLDNLMDLSHAAYIHAGTLSPSRAKRESQYDSDDTSIRVHTQMRDVPTPSSQALYFTEERGDYHSDIEWVFPGTLRQRLAMTSTGGEADQGAVTRNAHLITPETETSTHYFWIHTRNRRLDDTAIDERTRTIITNAFRTEDEPMIAACQDYMDGREFFSLQPLYLETDYAGTRCRRAIEKRIAGEERGIGVVDPQLESAG